MAYNSRSGVFSSTGNPNIDPRTGLPYPGRMPPVWGGGVQPTAVTGVSATSLPPLPEPPPFAGGLPGPTPAGNGDNTDPMVQGPPQSVGHMLPKGDQWRPPIGISTGPPADWTLSPPIIGSTNKPPETKPTTTSTTGTSANKAAKKPKPRPKPATPLQYR